MVKFRRQLINQIIRVEGGYVNDPSDSGGETNWGITVKTARLYGYTGSMKTMTQGDAEAIYIERYWNPLKLDLIADIAPQTTEELLDISVNMGVRRAGEFLQRLLNVMNNRGRYYDDIDADGIVGGRTLEALHSYIGVRGRDGDRVLMGALNCMQGGFYIDLAERRSKDERFVYGWLKNRVV